MPQSLLNRYLEEVHYLAAVVVSEVAAVFVDKVVLVEEVVAGLGDHVTLPDGPKSRVERSD